MTPGGGTGSILLCHQAAWQQTASVPQDIWCFFARDHLWQVSRSCWVKENEWQVEPLQCCSGVGLTDSKIILFRSGYSSWVMARSFWATNWTFPDIRFCKWTTHWNSRQPYAATVCSKSFGSPCIPIFYSMATAATVVAAKGPTSWTKPWSTCHAALPLHTAREWPDVEGDRSPVRVLLISEMDKGSKIEYRPQFQGSVFKRVLNFPFFLGGLFITFCFMV